MPVLLLLLAPSLLDRVCRCCCCSVAPDQPRSHLSAPRIRSRIRSRVQILEPLGGRVARRLDGSVRAIVASANELEQAKESALFVRGFGPCSPSEPPPASLHGKRIFRDANSVAHHSWLLRAKRTPPQERARKQLVPVVAESWVEACVQQLRVVELKGHIYEGFTRGVSRREGLREARWEWC